MNLRPRDLRTPFVLQRKVKGPKDQYGQPTEEWVEQFAGYCLIRPLTAKEAYYAGGVKEGTAFRIFMRYRDDVRVKDRLVLADGRIVNLTSVADYEYRHQWLDCQGA